MQVKKTVDELGELAFAVCWQQATERPGTGRFLHHDEPGQYHCVCCNAYLFDSTQKYSSGCGWPSFFQSQPNAIDYRDDSSHGMQRTEIVCMQCKSHLGHVFNDGPAPTYTRYCVNSVSLSFDAEQK